MQRKIKNIFLTGLAVVVPIGVTIYILFFLIAMMDGFLAIIPAAIHPDKLLGIRVPGLGVIFTFILIFLIGLITKSWIGNKIVNLGERLFGRIPVVRSIYQGTKQLVDALFTAKAGSFKKVVLFEYPRKGIYTVGFVTGQVRGELQEKTEEKYLNVFVPTTPNPTSGYYLMVPEQDVINTEMTVEDAFKLVISGGLVYPGDKAKT
jgi:uncharacterized membrane protein